MKLFSLEMATPLGTTFSTDEQVVTQGDVTFMGRKVESLVLKFDQAKYEGFLSSGSKSLRVARQYRRISSKVRSQVPSGTSSKIAYTSNHFWPHRTRSMRQRLPQDPQG